MWNPRGVLPRLIENYAPVHLLLHALEWQAFGDDVFGYHVVNVVLHALASTLLVAFLLRSGIPALPAAAGGALFLLHPANVEAVAWISQLKSSAALVLSLLALLAEPRRPLLGALLFGLALLAKPSALYALPVALLCVSLDPERSGARWRGLALWGLVFAAFAAVELAAFSGTAGSLPPLYADLLVRVRSSVAIGLRYLVMAASGYGLSTFHEPDPVASWLDPWWLGGLAAAAAIAWRFVLTLRARRVEAVFWLWAAAAYAPASGVLALPYPLADRYLYFVLPGLIGALLLAGGELLGRVARLAGTRGRREGSARAAGSAAAALLVAVLLVGFAVRTHARAALWRSPFLVIADAERNYPQGTAAKTGEAVRAARAGDVERAVTALRAAHRRGYNRLDQILAEPAYQPLREDPRFRALLDDIASANLRRLAGVETPTQLDLQAMAIAHVARGDTRAAIAALERALELGGPADEQIRQGLAELRRSQGQRGSVDRRRP